MSTISNLIDKVSALAVWVGDTFQSRGFKEGGTAGQVPVKTDGTDFNWSWQTLAGGAGTGDVVGPASATNNAVAIFDGTTGKLLKNGVVLGTAATSNTGDFAAAVHTHVSANITDATVSGTANRVVIRGAAGQANFNATTGSTAVGGAASGTGGGGLFSSVGGTALTATSTTGTGAIISSQDGTGVTISSDTGTHLNVGFDALVVNSDGDTVLGGNVSALNLEGTNTGDNAINSSSATAAQGIDERIPTAAGLTSKFGTNKATIVDADRVAILDSAAANAPKHSLFSLVKSTLKTYFDTLYAAIIHTHLSELKIYSASGGGTMTVNWEDGSFIDDRLVYLQNADGTIALTSDLSSYQPLDTQLTSLAGLSYASNTLKVVRVNSGETGFELATISAGGGDALTSNPLSQFAATTSAQLAGVISDETGTGALVFANSPTLVTPALGTPSSGTLTNCTGLPAAGVTGLGTLATQSGTFSGTSSGTNTGDQSSIVGITGTIAQFNTAVTDADFATLAGTETITNKTLTNPTVTNFTEGVVAIGNSGTSQTLALTSGTFQTVTLNSNCTFTLPTATAGKSFILKVMTGAGSYTATFTGVKWSGGTAPTITATASKYDLVSFVADGTAWSGSIIPNFTA